ncbi:MAG: signal peptidase I, partial [Nanoarchaeota archaeon]
IGDVVIIKNYPKSDIKVGDIIVYYVPSLNKYIIHRVVKIKKENNTICFETMGDNNVRFVFYNDNPQLYFEKNVCNIEGKVILKIPYLGLPRFWLYKWFGV